MQLSTGHQQPEVNYLPCFENDDLPCSLNVFHEVCRVNQHSRNGANSSLQVGGGGRARTQREASRAADSPPAREFFKVNIGRSFRTFRV